MFRADDVIELLPGLAGERPVFHSEADFQQALAWAIHVAQSRPSARNMATRNPMSQQSALSEGCAEVT